MRHTINNTFHRGRLPRARGTRYGSHEDTADGGVRWVRSADRRAQWRTEPYGPSIPIAITALVLLVASLVLTGIVVRTGMGSTQVTAITAVSVFVFIILAKVARVPWGYVALVSIPYALAVVAVLFLTATDDGPYTSWQALECLVAYHPMGFGIGLFSGMIVATWNE